MRIMDIVFLYFELICEKGKFIVSGNNFRDNRFKSKELIPEII